MTMRYLEISAIILVAALTAGPVRSGVPTQATIVLDGSFDDWQTVLANPANTVFDGDGSSIPCSDSSDRDCIISSPPSDLQSFAFTWDDQNLYLLFRRFGSSTNRNFHLYIDTDNDAVMEPFDLVLVHEFKVSQGFVSRAAHLYNPSDSFGDSIVDALGFADGYTLPGGVGNTTGPAQPDCSSCIAPDGLAFEIAWAWSDLGMTPGQAFQYHVSSTASSGQTIEDNMAGRFGRGGGTGYRKFSLDDPVVTSGSTGSNIWIPHVFTNEGNQLDGLELRVLSGLGLQVCLYEDLDEDMTPDQLLGCDKKGDGDFTDSGDLRPTDWDGDTFPDSPNFWPGERYPVLVELYPTNQARNKVETLTLIGTSKQDDEVSAKVADTISLGDVTIYPAHHRLADHGATVPLAHRIDNHLESSDTFSVQVLQDFGWSYQLWSDPDGDGDPADGAPIFDTTGDTVPDVTVPAGGTLFIVALVDVPIGAPLGQQERLIISLESTGGISVNVTDTIGVSERVVLAPSYLEAEGTAKAGSATYPVFFRHTLRWAGDQPDTFDLVAVSSQGFPLDFFSDPDGDGNPSDGALLPEPVTSPQLEAFGGSWTFLIRVTIPAGAAPGTLEASDVYALAQSDASFNDDVRDETRVTLVQAFQDPGRTLSLSHTAACTTVYARATGLVPSQSNRYRLLWQDPQSVAVQVTPFATDANGEGFDELALGATSPLGQWGVAIQEDQGGAWVDLDRWFFEVQNPGTLDLFSVDPPAFMVLDDTLTVHTVFRNNGQVDLGPLDLRFRIRTPDGSMILDSDGAFGPYTGTEVTWTTPLPALTAGSSTESMWTISGITWEATGFHLLEAEWQNECGGTMAGDTRTLELYDDFDGDGANDLQEVREGLDPLDRDTDDDGLIDGPDGFGDADGDTLIDALECDADGDGLEDGLEAGMTAATADADTNMSAGCFREDADGGATTTSHVEADTDSGGIDDGSEDANRNGRVDPGEGDPNDPADDSCPPGTPSEVTGVRVSRDGVDIRLEWDVHPDPCATYRVYSGEDPGDTAGWSVVVEDLPIETWIHGGVAGEGRALRGWLLQAVSPVGGDGSL